MAHGSAMRFFAVRLKRRDSVIRYKNLFSRFWVRERLSLPTHSLVRVIRPSVKVLIGLLDLYCHPFHVLILGHVL